MQRINHTKFIKTPISKILIETINICRALGNRMETYPISEYIFQTTFLKMAGASEQKLKCICWEMATNDYEYRYEVLSKPLGECSTYKDKKEIFKNIFLCIKRINPNSKIDLIFDDNAKDEILNNLEPICPQIENSILITWHRRNYKEFLQYSKKIKIKDFCNYQKPNQGNEATFNLFENELKNFYENVVYRQRNRCAHNLNSYQMNIPSLSSLTKEVNNRNNYFMVFYVLMLLDEIFMRAYKKFLEVCSESFWV